MISNNHPKVTLAEDDEDEEYYNDIMELSPSEFFSKYHQEQIFVDDDEQLDGIIVEPIRRKRATFQDVSSDVLCYIIMTYLDWKTVFSSCLLVNKEFFRRIANNRVLFINLFNELFVLNQVEIDDLKVETTFKHKQPITSERHYSQYGGLGVPNEHYHFCRDYENAFPEKSEFSVMHNFLKKYYVKKRLMTESKLRLIREKWNNAISTYKKSKNMKQITSKKEENQALLNLIKRIIKDRLFMRKFFNNGLKSVRLEYLGEGQFYRSCKYNYLEAKKLASQQLPFKTQVEKLVYGESSYEMTELEEIVIGDHGSYSATDDFIDQLQVYSYVDCENIVSFLANDIPDNQRMISCISTSDIKNIFTTFPKLKAFVCRGRFNTISPVKSIHLTVLVLATGGMSSETLNGILNCEFPQLKHLELWFGSYDYGNSIHAPDLEGLLSPEENGKYPLLEYFGIRNSQQLDQFLIPIANSNILTMLRILDLSLCGISTGTTLLDFSKMLEKRNSFPLLELVDMHRNLITDVDKDQILEIFDRLGIIIDFSSYKYSRYIAVGE